MINRNELIEFFNVSPTPSLVLLPNIPKFTILEVNNAYLEVTKSKREDLIGKGIFEVFPENKNDATADGIKNLKASLNTVITTKKSHKMAIQKYDLPIRGTSKFEPKYWKSQNFPLIGDDGKLKMIFHTVTDVTESILSNKKREESRIIIATNELAFQNEEREKRALEFVIATNELVFQNIEKEKRAAELNIANKELIYQNEEKENRASELIIANKELAFQKKEKGNRADELIIANKEKIKKAEELIAAYKAIEESNERFEYVSKATFDAIWDWNLATDRIYWGEGFEKIFSHKISKLEDNSASWRKNIHLEDLQRITDSYYNIIKSTETNWVEEYRFKKGDGNYSYVINKGIVIRDTTNRAIRIIGAMHDITQKKLEEKRLKLLESVVTNASDSVLITEAEPFDLPGNRILFVNEAFTKMTGYTAEEVIGKTPRILQGPKTDRDELNKLGAALRRWEACEATLLNYKKNGEEFWLNISISPVADETGLYTHWIAIERDVTKQKEEEERLKLLETVIINTNDAVVIKEAKPSSELGRKIVYVNESFTRMTGYSESEIKGKTHKLLQGPKTDPAELAQFYKALDEEQPTEITIINYKKNGEEFWVNLALNPVFNDKGKNTHWVSIERDVTERKIQEQKLIEISQKLLDTLESIQDGFYTLDNNWNISYWNHEAERVSGKSQQEMIGKNFWEVYDGRISKIIYSKFHDAKKLNKPILLEVHSKMQNKWFELNAFPSSLGLTIYFKDITERKKTESKLKKVNQSLETYSKELAISNKELEEFAYVASHDLQEPLRMITGFLGQIEKKYEDVLDEKGKKYIFFAVDGAKRMRQIILDLLEFSRIGKNENKLEEINLNHIVDEIVLLYGKQIEEKKAKITHEKLPKLKSYSAPIKQIFRNLISNSLKYSKSDTNPIITISSEETTLAWKFIIQDNGIGIDSEYFSKIFILFQRLHNKDEYSGTGIGLAITKKIIESLGGQIWVESEEGIGSTFQFTIPKKQTKKL